MTPAILTSAEIDFIGSGSSSGSSVWTKKKGERVCSGSGNSSPELWAMNNAGHSRQRMRISMVFLPRQSRRRPL